MVFYAPTALIFRILSASYRYTREYRSADTLNVDSVYPTEMEGCYQREMKDYCFLGCPIIGWMTSSARRLCCLPECPAFVEWNATRLNPWQNGPLWQT